MSKIVTIILSNILFFVGSIILLWSIIRLIERRKKWDIFHL